MKISDMLDPNLSTVLNRCKEEIFRDINCVAIGKIDSVNYGDQTVEALIVYKRQLENGETKEYPMVLDVPFLVLQGGGAYIEMPITKGDYCVILFNDRNFSIWWDSANEKEPESSRKHSLSDGIAIVGINPKTKVLGLDGLALRLKAPEIDLNGNAKTFVTGDELAAALQQYHAALFSAIAAAAGGTPPTPGSLPAPDITAAKTTTIKTGG
jgi:hypothetical protein